MGRSLTTLTSSEEVNFMVCWWDKEVGRWDASGNTAEVLGDRRRG